MKHNSEPAAFPPLSHNEFDPPHSFSILKQPQIIVSSLDLQAVHMAMVRSMIYSRARRGQYGLLQVPRPETLSYNDMDQVQALLRACVGYYSRKVSVPTLKIPARIFLALCDYLRVHPLQILASSVVEVWDPVTKALYKLGLSEIRRAWGHG